MVPWGFRELLKHIKNTYNNPPVFVTENGFCDKDVLEDKGRVDYHRVRIFINKNNRIKIILKLIPFTEILSSFNDTYLGTYFTVFRNILQKCCTQWMRMNVMLLDTQYGLYWITFNGILATCKHMKNSC